MLSLIKTAILFAIVIALFTLFGALIALILGDPTPVMIFIFIACILCGAVFIFSKRIIILMTGAKPMDLVLYRDYSIMVDEISVKYKLPKPGLFITQDLQANIISAGRGPGDSVIIITQSTFNILSREEILSILAHEASHIKKYDSMLGSVSAVLASIILYPAYIKLNRDSAGSQGKLPVIMELFMQAFIYLGVFTARFGTGENRELNADKSVIKCMNTGTILASALRKIAASTKTSPLYTNPVINSLYIFDPLGGNGSNISNLFLTHPFLEKRISMLTGN